MVCVGVSDKCRHQAVRKSFNGSRSPIISYTPLCKERNLLEGELASFVVDGREILLVWPDGGNLKAYQGTCPHQHVSLQRGEFNGRIIICPVHRWVFDGRTGKGLQPAGCALSEYPLRIEDGVVQVDVSVTSSAEVSADHCP
jgi:toluene monooxygenase system ferredoxin subunit